MKITKRDIGVLMILVGILVAFLVYQTSFKTIMEEVEALQNEQNSLRAQIKDLEPVKANAPFYQNEMARYEKEIDELVAKYPVDIIYEDGIMYIVNLKEEVDVDFTTLTVTPAATNVISTVEGNAKRYSLTCAVENVSYEADDYESLKALLTYIYSSEEFKNTITSVAMSFDDEEGSISGSMNVNMYVLSDGSRIYTPVEIPEEFTDDEHTGVECIFGETVEAEETEEER